MAERLCNLKKYSGGGSLHKVTIGSSNSQSSRSFNVANILPDVYQTLTLSNFAIEQAKVAYTSTSSSTSIADILLSYDSSTGTLNCSASKVKLGVDAYVAYTICAYYVG